MTAVDERVESIEHLDFEAPCSITECANVASFVLTCRFCGDIALECLGHVSRLVALNSKPGAFECESCRHLEDDLFDIVHIHPLKP